MDKREMVTASFREQSERLLNSGLKFGGTVGVSYLTKIFEFKLMCNPDVPLEEQDETMRQTLYQLANVRPALMLDVVLADSPKEIHQNLIPLIDWLDTRGCQLIFINQNVWYKQLRTKFFLYTGIWLG